MPIPLHLRGVKGDECQCGRRKSVRHCPSCGSTRIYGYSQEQWLEREGQSPIKVRLYRCIGCGHRFTDDERQYCEAPPVSQALAILKLKAIKEADKTGEYLNPVDQRIAQALKLVEETKSNNEEQKTYTDTELKNMWFSLRRAWVDLKIQNKGVVELPLLDFLMKYLREAKMPQQYIDQILSWQREETARLEVSGG